MTFAIFVRGEIVFETLADKYGDLLSSGEAKDHLFQFWRDRCADPAVEAFACGSEAWGYQENEIGEKFRKSNPRAHRSMIDSGFVTLISFGHGERCEMFTVAAQDRERAVLMHRTFVRTDGVITWTGEPVTREIPQSDFKGRQKMWGDLRPENLS